MARPDLIKSAVNALLAQTLIDTQHIQPFISGLLNLYPESSSIVQSTCLKQKTHPDLAVNIITEYTDRKFVTIMEMIFSHHSETSKWLIVQFQNSLTMDSNTIRKMREKIMSIVDAISQGLVDGGSHELLSYGLAALRVWCVMKTLLNVRFTIEGTGLTFGATKLIFFYLKLFC